MYLAFYLFLTIAKSVFWHQDHLSSVAFSFASLTCVQEASRHRKGLQKQFKINLQGLPKHMEQVMEIINIETSVFASCPCWEIWNFRTLRPGNGATLRYVYIYIYIHTQTQLFRSLILERFWRGSGERTLETKIIKHAVFYKVR